jgi:hypothetical protein
MTFVSWFVRGEPRVNPPPIRNDRDIELNDLNDLRRDAPPPQPSPNAIAPLRFKKDGPWFAVLIAFTLGFTAIGLHAPYADLKKEAQWTRKNSDEMLTHGQVLFTSIPRREIWARYICAVCLQVFILEIVYRYAEWATSTPDGTKKRKIAWFRNLFFTVAVFFVAFCTWGWMMFFI